MYVKECLLYYIDIGAFETMMLKKYVLSKVKRAEKAIKAEHVFLLTKAIYLIEIGSYRK